MILVHSKDSKDPYLRASFTIAERARRLLWRSVWILFCRYSPIPLHGWRTFVLRIFGAKLGRNCSVYPRASIWAPWLLRLGDTVTIANDVEVYNPGGVILGARAILSQGAFICGASHDFNDESFPMISKLVTIESYAWICSRAVVLPGVTVGEGAVLGAAAVASKNLERWSVYAGNPARLVGLRNRDVVDERQMQ